MSKVQQKNKNVEAIEKCLAQKAWRSARHHLQERLVSAPTDHWIWFSLSLAYYEDKKYEEALECSRRAIELQPGCPLALWHYAGSLFMNRREDLAFAIWIRLLDMDIEEIAYGEHGEGMDRALQLVNDVHFKLAKYYQWVGKPAQAVESTKKYLHNRKHGVTSIYDIEDARAIVLNPDSREAD
jgi:tetratricopeptide (TPR) repeat protein